MRIDKFLKLSRIIKRRTVANEMCDAGRVLVNDKPAKASVQLSIGDKITLNFGNGASSFVVKNIKETVRKDEAASLYEQV